jgi:hypothetical protein
VARVFPDNLFSQYKNIFIHKNVRKHKIKKNGKYKKEAPPLQLPKEDLRKSRTEA